MSDADNAVLWMWSYKDTEVSLSGFYHVGEAKPGTYSAEQDCMIQEKYLPLILVINIVF